MSSELGSKFASPSNIHCLSENLKRLMNHKNIDVSQLCEKTGIAATTINNLKRGAGNPTLSTLQALSEFFGITMSQLTETSLSDDYPTSFKPNQEIPICDLHEIDNFLANQNKHKNYMLVDIGQHTRENCFAIKATNNSMAPLFDKGTIFVICKNLMPQDGDIVLVKFSNHLPCFRKVFIEEDTYFFNPVTELLGKELSKCKNFAILGIVIKAIQYFHE